MKFFLAIVAMIFALSSCQNKTFQLLNKKWDCTKIENLDPVNSKKFTSPEDSAAAVKVEDALRELNWTFNKNLSYQCSIGDKTVTQGTYQLTEDEKTLICTPDSKNTVNRYTITSLTEDELVLSNQVDNIRLIIYFKTY